MLTTARLLDDPQLPFRDPLQCPDAVVDLLRRDALPALYPGRELTEAAALDFTYTPGRKCMGLYALRFRGGPDDRPRLAAITHTRNDELQGIHASRYGGGTEQAVYLAEQRCLVESFPADWELPTLASAFDPAAVAALLGGGPTPETNAGARPPPTVEVVRHRPHVLCVLRYRGLDSSAGGTREVIGKVYPAGTKASELGLKLAAIHPRAAARGFAVPRPLAVVDEWNLVLMERLGGTSAKELLEQAATPSAAKSITGAAARALAGLHSLPLTSGERRSLATELDRLQKRAARLPLVVPLLAEQVDSLLRRLRSRLLATRDERTCLIHGDYKPSQLLAERDRIGIVDFDRACLGDPAIDLGAFMAQCHKEAIATGRSDLREPAESFTDEYAAHADGVDDGLRHRARLMRVLSLVRIAVRMFLHAPLAYARDAASSRTELLLREAATCLAELDR